jgi:hypothetical protein
MNKRCIALTLIAIALTLSSGNASCQNCFPAELTSFNAFPIQTVGRSENYRSSLTFDKGASSLERRVREREDSQSTWSSIDAGYSTSYKISAVASRLGGDVLFISGINTSDCSDIIEKWTFPRKRGARQLEPSHSVELNPSLEVGQSAPALSLQPTIAGGGPFITTANRTLGTRGPVRETLYSGSSLGHIRSLFADPEGRFILLQAHGDSAIYQIDLTGPSQHPQLVISLASVPALAATKTMQGFGRIGSSERFIVLTETFGGVEGGAWNRVVMRDVNNDGIMDAFEEFDSQSWSNSPWADSSQWVKLTSSGT